MVGRRLCIRVEVQNYLLFIIEAYSPIHFVSTEVHKKLLPLLSTSATHSSFNANTLKFRVTLTNQRSAACQQPFRL